ncbi:MAG: HAD hydrolase-like protein [Arcanobacterium sp.]|nr:HAD hydrolase-like protein [Arcanobacterium sp.]
MKWLRKKSNPETTTENSTVITNIGGMELGEDAVHPNLVDIAVMVEDSPQSLHDSYIINLDSTVLTGDVVVPGVETLLKSLAYMRRPVYFLSTNPYMHPADFVTRLANVGINIDAEQVFTPSRIAATYLQKEFAAAKIFAVANQSFQEELRNRGVNLTDDELAADVVLVSHNRDFNFEIYTKAFRALTGPRQPKLISTSMVRTRTPMGGEPEPGTRGLVRALESATRKKLDKNLGRPDRDFLDVVFQTTGLNPEYTLFVSDSLTQDIRPVKRYGVQTALVLGGETTIEAAKAAKKKDQPNFVLDDITAIIPEYILAQMNTPELFLLPEEQE